MKFLFKKSAPTNLKLLITAAVAVLMGVTLTQAQQLGAYVRRSTSLSTNGVAYGNFSFEVTISDIAEKAGVSQVVGLAFGNDRESKAAKRAPTR